MTGKAVPVQAEARTSDYSTPKTTRVRFGLVFQNRYVFSEELAALFDAGKRFA